MSNTPMVVSNFMDQQVVKIPLIFNAGGTEVDTGFALPMNSVIYHNEMFVGVTALDSGETVDVGILSTQASGDADGFIALLSVASLNSGKLLSPTVTLTQGTNAHYISATTWGVLFLAAATKGANTAEQNAVPVFTPYVCDGTAKNISYTPSSSDTFTGFLMFRVHMYPF